VEQELAYNLEAGYLKGGEQANIPITFNVISNLGSASEYANQISSFNGHNVIIAMIQQLFLIFP
jgi:hypothetical protein